MIARVLNWPATALFAAITLMLGFYLHQENSSTVPPSPVTWEPGQYDRLAKVHLAIKGLNAEPEHKNENAVPPAIVWRLVAVTKHQQGAFVASVLDQYKQTYRVHIGDTLPDGTKIVDVQSASATIAQGEAIKTLTLFHKNPGK